LFIAVGFAKAMHMFGFFELSGRASRRRSTTNSTLPSSNTCPHTPSSDRIEFEADSDWHDSSVLIFDELE
jgi:hypothetical protein